MSKAYFTVNYRGKKIYKCTLCPFDCDNDLPLMERHQREIHKKEAVKNVPLSFVQANEPVGLPGNPADGEQR